MAADWEGESSQLQANLVLVLARIQQQASQRSSPTAETARIWQRDMLDGLAVPAREYVGLFRGEPGLEGIEVRIGRHFGVQADRVAEALKAFEETLQEAVDALDRRIHRDDELGADELAAVLDLCAWVHAEWVRIHPFANGNGRTARLWANFIAMRYGLPPFVRLRPRPNGNGDYATVADEAMKGNWQATVPLFRQMLRDAVREDS